MTDRPRRILVVDDEPDTCANLHDIFTDQGYRVDMAHDGASALELVKDNPYDLALLDLKMPGMDGLELCRRIKDLRSDTVALIVTAYADVATAQAVTAAGAWQVLSKPVDLPRLLALADEALGQPLVLVVDDDHDLCLSLVDLFRDRGYRVSLAHDVPEAESRLQEETPQVVLIDMKLPRGNGDQVLALVQQANPPARTVLITGYRTEMEERIRQALARGADAVCYKPFHMEEMLRTVERLVAAQRN